MMLINFYLDRNLQIGKEIIDHSFQKGESKFIENFKQVEFTEPDNTDRSAMTRYKRRVLAYRALLAQAGFIEPRALPVSPKSLFSKELLLGRPNAKDPNARFNGMDNVTSDPDKTSEYKSAAAILDNPQATLKNWFFRIERTCTKE